MSCYRSVPQSTVVATNGEDVEKIGRHIFYDELRIAPKEHNVLLAKAPWNLKTYRERKTQTVFISYASLFTAMELSVFNRGWSGLRKSLTAKSLTAAPMCSVF